MLHHHLTHHHHLHLLSQCARDRPRLGIGRSWRIAHLPGNDDLDLGSGRMYRSARLCGVWAKLTARTGGQIGAHGRAIVARLVVACFEAYWTAFHEHERAEDLESSEGQYWMARTAHHADLVPNHRRVKPTGVVRGEGELNESAAVGECEDDGLAVLPAGRQGNHLVELNLARSRPPQGCVRDE